MASIKFVACAVALLATCAILAPAALATTNCLCDLRQIPLVGSILVGGSAVPITGVFQVLSFVNNGGKVFARGKLTLVDLSNSNILNNVAIGDILSKNTVDVPVLNVNVLNNAGGILGGNILSNNNQNGNTGLLGGLLGRRMLTLTGCAGLSLDLGPLDTVIEEAEIVLSQVGTILITVNTLGALITSVVGSLLCSLAQATGLDAIVLILNQLLALLYLPL